MSGSMTINEVIATLGSLRQLSISTGKDLGSAPDARNCEADACETAIRILAALAEEGCIDLDGVLDIISDYQGLAKQYQTMRKKYGDPAKPKRKDGAWHCPGCNGRVQSSYSYCPRCGKKIGWV